MNFGIQNEKEFAKVLDNRKINELPEKYQELIYSLFKNVNGNSRIECWKSHYYYEKADIKIRISSELKGISIKTGKSSSMHQEKTETFYLFLSKIGVDKNIVQYFENFIKGYVNDRRVDSKTYIKYHKNEINDIREKFNEYYIKTNLIIRFLFQGTETQRYDCDAIIHGNPKNFLWATKNEILKYLIEYETKDANYLNFSALNIKCYDRNLRNNPKRLEGQNEIQVKWYTIEDDLKNISKIRKSAKNVSKNKNL